MSGSVLVDVNVLMDVLNHRQPHYAASAEVWTAVEQHGLVGWVSADSFSTLYYLLRKASGRNVARRGVQLVSKVFAVVPVDAALLEKALQSPLGDFEDAIQYECALRIKAAAIITRDARHFRHTAIPAMSPVDFVAGFNLT